MRQAALVSQGSSPSAVLRVKLACYVGITQSCPMGAGLRLGAVFSFFLVLAPTLTAKMVTGHCLTLYDCAVRGFLITFVIVVVVAPSVFGVVCFSFPVSVFLSTFVSKKLCLNVSLTKYSLACILS